MAQQADGVPEPVPRWRRHGYLRPADRGPPGPDARRTGPGREPGRGGGTVGAANAAKRLPDGYNWFFGAVHHTIAESLYTRLSYSLEKDFEPITIAAFVPNVVVVHPKHADKFKTLKDLIAYAKANPDKLNYGSAGSGTTHHLSVELFKTMTQTKLVHVPYKGAGPLMIDLAGQVDLAFDGMGTSAQQIKAGKLIRSRSPATSAIPCFPTSRRWRRPECRATRCAPGMRSGRSGTPQAIKDRMYREIVAAINHPDLKRIWAEQGADRAACRPPRWTRS